MGKSPGNNYTAPANAGTLNVPATGPGPNAPGGVAGLGSAVLSGGAAPTMVPGTQGPVKGTGQVKGDPGTQAIGPIAQAAAPNAAAALGLPSSLPLPTDWGRIAPLYRTQAQGIADRYAHAPSLEGYLQGRQQLAQVLSRGAQGYYGGGSGGGAGYTTSGRGW